MPQATRFTTITHALSYCLLTVSLLLAAGVSAEETSESHPVPSITPAAVKEWLNTDTPVTFLDVREKDEFIAGHLPHAINIPYDQVDRLTDELSHDQPIVLYCIHSAHRAPEAAKTLRRLGFTNAFVLEGGIVAWEAGGLTIQAGDLAQVPKILPKTARCEAVRSQ